MALSLGSASAQDRFAIKTNFLHDATASVNLGVEVGLAPKWTVALEGSFNTWNPSLNHWFVSPEARYWLCKRFSGNFFSVHGNVGMVNVGGFEGADFSTLNYRFPNLESFYLKDALVYSIGVGFGHAFILGRHWNLELEACVGYLCARGDEYELKKNAEGKMYLPDNSIPVLDGSVFDYIGPTKLACSIVYIF